MMFFLKQCRILKHTLARGKEKEKGRAYMPIQCISPCLLDIMSLLQFDCPLVGTFTTRDH